MKRITALLTALLFTFAGVVAIAPAAHAEDCVVLGVPTTCDTTSDAGPAFGGEFDNVDPNACPTTTPETFRLHSENLLLTQRVADLTELVQLYEQQTQTLVNKLERQSRTIERLRAKLAR